MLTIIINILCFEKNHSWSVVDIDIFQGKWKQFDFFMCINFDVHSVGNCQKGYFYEDKTSYPNPLNRVVLFFHIQNTKLNFKIRAFTTGQYVVLTEAFGLHRIWQTHCTDQKPETQGRYELLEDFGKDRPHLFQHLAKQITVAERTARCSKRIPFRVLVSIHSECKSKHCFHSAYLLVTWSVLLCFFGNSFQMR